VAKLKNNVRINDKELELLEAVSTLGPCSSEKVHESIDPKNDYLLVMRTLHRLVEKGFLQRIIINQKQLYRTSRQYSYMKSFLGNQD
jgi:predicted transcriptional regulator